MGIFEAKIKEELAKELYTNIDKIYDALEQKLILEKAQRDTMIRELNKLKDQLYLIIGESKLS
ncbi:MAG: hypothetical protein K0U47_09045 [Epsilonproteobacteria bacterium]|nr:hypothetical protein [Campylobacterota bacterium]